MTQLSRRTLTDADCLGHDAEERRHYWWAQLGRGAESAAVVLGGSGAGPSGGHCVSRRRCETQLFGAGSTRHPLCPHLGTVTGRRSSESSDTFWASCATCGGSCGRRPRSSSAASEIRTGQDATTRGRAHRALASCTDLTWEKAYSRTLSNIALSSGEAEFYALVANSSEALGIAAVTEDSGDTLEAYSYADASAAIGVAGREGVGVEAAAASAVCGSTRGVRRSVCARGGMRQGAAG